MTENIDRREFLKRSGGATAGALLTNFKTGRSLFDRAAQEATAVRPGVIGTGDRGRSLRSNLLAGLEG